MLIANHTSHKTICEFQYFIRDLNLFAFNNPVTVKCLSTQDTQFKGPKKN